MKWKRFTRRIPDAWQLRRMTGGFRSMPDWMIIGAGKAGTTSLFHYLSRHPNVYGSTRKETHFFDRNFYRGQNWYRAHFPLTWRKKLDQLRSGHVALTGEATPSYLFHPHAPKRVKQFNPGVKLFVLLREPVERIISHYHYQVKKNREPRPFRKAICGGERQLSQEWHKMQKDPSYYSYEYQYFAYRQQSHYAPQIRRWLRHFSRNRFKFVPSKLLFQQPNRTLQSVNSFLNLPDYTLDEYRVYNPGDYETTVDSETVRELKRYFEVPNRNLFNLIGKRMEW